MGSCLGAGRGVRASGPGLHALGAREGVAMKVEKREKYLKIALVVFGLVFLVGLLPMTMLFPGGWMWEPRQSEYEQMILVVYAVLGIFLLQASKKPFQHRSLIAFTAWSSLAHGGVMLVQALRDSTEHANLYGDVPATLAVGLIFLWLCPRKE
jgi:Family of unknown function (DUF6632)